MRKRPPNNYRIERGTLRFALVLQTFLEKLRFNIVFLLKRDEECLIIIHVDDPR